MGFYHIDQEVVYSVKFESLSGQIPSSLVMLPQKDIAQNVKHI